MSNCKMDPSIDFRTNSSSMGFCIRTLDSKIWKLRKLCQTMTLWSNLLSLKKSLELLILNYRILTLKWL